MTLSSLSIVIPEYDKNLDPFPYKLSMFLLLIYHIVSSYQCHLKIVQTINSTWSCFYSHWSHLVQTINLHMKNFLNDPCSFWMVFTHHAHQKKLGYILNYFTQVLICPWDAPSEFFSLDARTRVRVRIRLSNINFVF